jgi:integrase
LVQFTDLAIRALKPPATGYAYVWDSALRGFGVRLSANSGSKTFCVLIGKGRRQTIGKYGPRPPDITLADAREAARRILAEKTLGKVRPTHTAFDDALDAFLKDCETRLRPITVRLYRRYLTSYFPFGRKSVGDIEPREIVRRLNPLKPSEKEHAHRTGRTFFRWCVGQHILDRSPMETIARPPLGQPRERVLSDEELKAVYSTARKAQNAFPRLICLLIHTGCRRGELTQLQWAHIGPDVIALPGEITKNRRNHTFPIGPRTQSLIATFPRIADNPYVFPAARETFKGIATTVMTGYSEAKRDFDKACGVTGWTLHDLRRTFSTGLASLGVAPHIIERLINHTTGVISGVSATYNRFAYMPEMREAVGKWEAHLAALL